MVGPRLLGGSHLPLRGRPGGGADRSQRPFGESGSCSNLMLRNRRWVGSARQGRAECEGGHRRSRRAPRCSVLRVVADADAERRTIALSPADLLVVGFRKPRPTGGRAGELRGVPSERPRRAAIPPPRPSPGGRVTFSRTLAEIHSSVGIVGRWRPERPESRGSGRPIKLARVLEAWRDDCRERLLIRHVLGPSPRSCHRQCSGCSAASRASRSAVLQHP